MLWEESHLVSKRLNGQMASITSLMQMAIGSMLDKECGSRLRDAIKDMTDG